MKKTIVALMALLAAGVMLWSTAEEAWAFQAGHHELILGGSGSSDESFDGTILSANGSLGYFLTDHLEALVRQDMKYSERKAGDDLWNGGTRLGVDYHFNIGPVYPFLGASVGYLYGDTIEEQFVAGPQAGFKFFANSTTFILGMVEYEFFFEDTDHAEDNYDDGRFVYTLGIGFIW